MKALTISKCPDCPHKHTCDKAKLCGLIPDNCPLPDAPQSRIVGYTMMENGCTIPIYKEDK